MNYYLAIDIGASRGRHIVGWLENGVLKTEEIPIGRFSKLLRRLISRTPESNFGLKIVALSST